MVDRVTEIIDFLKKNGINASLFWENEIEFEIVYLSAKYKCICYLPESFPNTFPKIYVGNELFDIVKENAHIGKDKTVCTYDQNISIPNRNRPIELVYSTINRAIDIILSGLFGDNKQDFFDEFYAYLEKKTDISGNIIVGETNQLHSFCYRVDNFIFLNKNLAKKKGEIDEILPMVYADAADLLNFDFTVKGLSNVIKSKITNVYSFDKSSFFMIYTKVNESYYFLKTKIPKLSRVVGFRKQAKPPYGLVCKNIENANKKIICYTCQNGTQDYLFERGSDGMNKSQIKSIIVGCGSIGSNLANELKDFGVSNYTLLDKQILTTDNVGRHLCGFNYVGHNKIDAVADMLEKHNENIYCEKKMQDAYEFYKNYINNGSILFDTTGELNLCLTLLDYVKNYKITDKVIILWVEPFCAGAHAIILNNSNFKQEMLFNKDGKFQYNVLANGKDLNKRFSGCQSTFVPYSGSLVKMFLERLLVELFSSRLSEEKNYVITQIGDIKSCVAKDCKFIKDFESFSFLVNEI